MTLLSRAKTLLPLPARRALKTGWAAAQDIANPIRDARVPPRRKTLIGGGDFITVGNATHSVLMSHGLQPGHKVLEPGCGQARMARPMIGWLQGGHYTGFDIDASMIDWCQDQYADLEDFTFHHLNIHNPLYNPGGTIKSSEARFPVADASQDFVFMTSVFTHMQLDDVRHYLRETARVLKPGGRSVISWFVLEPEQAEDRMGFHHARTDGSRTTVAQLSEAAIAFPRTLVDGAYADAGLQPTEFQRGQWAGGSGPIGLQDLMIADKPG
jgi:SAM-dependent methyltransferase